MSAVWAQIATTLCLDLTNIFSQFRFIVGDSAMLMTLSQWIATFLASIALWTYNVEPEVRYEDSQDLKCAKSEGRSLAGSMVSDGHASLIQALSYAEGHD